LSNDNEVRPISPLVHIQVLRFDSAKVVYSMRMRFRIIMAGATLLFIATLDAAQTAPPQKQKLPSKQDLQGYSADVLEKAKSLPNVTTPQTYKAPAKPTPLDPKVEQELAAIVTKQFGTEFELFPSSPSPLLTGDLDGDGIEDAIIIVRSQHPLTQAGLYSFKAVSPQEDYFGFGDPKIALSTEFERWQDRKLLLVIHGSGKEGWRAEVPKAKFLIVNVPFDHLSISHVKLKKKVQDVINAEESSIMSSTVYWNGKKYKWEPNTAVQ
jgi:hypothetical protein